MEIPKMVWMEVDLKNKELPLRVADSAEELAKMCGLKTSSITSSVSKGRRGHISRYRLVWIGEDV